MRTRRMIGIVLAGAALALPWTSANALDVYQRLRDSLDALNTQERDLLRRYELVEQQIGRLQKERSDLNDYLGEVRRSRKDVETAMESAPK